MTERFSRKTALITGAGTGIGAVAEAMGGTIFAGDAEWQASANANLDTSMVILRAAQPELQKTKGAILTVDGGLTIVDVPTLAFG